MPVTIAGMMSGCHITASLLTMYALIQLVLPVGNSIYCIEIEGEKYVVTAFNCDCGNTIKVSHDAGIMNNSNAANYCSKCGCRLDWEEEDV